MTVKTETAPSVGVNMRAAVKSFKTNKNHGDRNVPRLFTALQPYLSELTTEENIDALEVMILTRTMNMGWIAVRGVEAIALRESIWGSSWSAPVVTCGTVIERLIARTDLHEELAIAFLKSARPATLAKYKKLIAEFQEDLL